MTSASLDRFQAAGQHVLRLFMAPEHLSRLAHDPQLLEAYLRLVEPHSIDQRLTFQDGSYRVEQPVIRSASGLGLQVPVDVVTMQVLLRLDSGNSVGGALEEAREALGLAPEEQKEKVLQSLRQLIELGVVVPAEH